MHTTLRLAALAAALSASAAAFAAAVGQPAPAFTVTDTGGKAVSLADFKGRHVVLEWVNPGCPFVVKHYSSANMQGTQKAATAKGVVWLAISSTAPDASDYRKPAELAKWMQGQKAAATAVTASAPAVKASTTNRGRVCRATTVSRNPAPSRARPMR